MTGRKKSSRRSAKRKFEGGGRSPWQPLLILLGLTVFGFAVWKFTIWVMSTKYFNVREVTVSGLRYVKENEVKAEVADAVGVNTFKLKISVYEERLEGLPWVKEARIYRELPSRLQVDISERELLALLNTRGGLTVVDSEGNLVAPPRVGEIYDLPLISGCVDGEGQFLEAVNFLRAAKTLCPQVYSKISEVYFLGRNLNLYALVDESAKRVKIGRGFYRDKVFKLWLALFHSEIDFNSFAGFDIRFPGKIFYTQN